MKKHSVLFAIVLLLGSAVWAHAQNVTEYVTRQLLTNTVQSLTNGNWSTNITGAKAFVVPPFGSGGISVASRGISDGAFTESYTIKWATSVDGTNFTTWPLLNQVVFVGAGVAAINSLTNFSDTALMGARYIKPVTFLVNSSNVTVYVSNIWASSLSPGRSSTVVYP
jgi:hypothetical protein